MKWYLVIKALVYAAWCHRHQRRKYTGECYIWHPIEVARMVWHHTKDHAMVCAALLHDTVEDTDATIEDIIRLFGYEVASLVSDLTDVAKPEDGNRATRMGINRNHTAQASPRAKTIKLADLVSNTKSIVSQDKDFAIVYLKEKELLLHVLTDGDARLYGLAAHSLIQGKLELAEQS